MKEENIHRRTIKGIEYSAIMVFFLVIIIIIYPSLSKIFYNMGHDSAITSTQGTIDTVKSFYIDMNLTNEVALPFKVVFDKDGYTYYENGKEVNYKRQLNIKNNGELPKSGSIEIRTDGTVAVVDLTFGNFKCNQTTEQNLVCDTEDN